MLQALLDGLTSQVIPYLWIEREHPQFAYLPTSNVIMLYVELVTLNNINKILTSSSIIVDEFFVKFVKKVFTNN